MILFHTIFFQLSKKCLRGLQSFFILKLHEKHSGSRWNWNPHWKYSQLILNRILKPYSRFSPVYSTNDLSTFFPLFSALFQSPDFFSTFFSFRMRNENLKGMEKVWRKSDVVFVFVDIRIWTHIGTLPLSWHENETSKKKYKLIQEFQVTELLRFQRV